MPSFLGAIDWPATLRQKGPEPLLARHLMRRPPYAAPAHLHLIVLDQSGSMGWHQRLARAKAFAARLIEALYRNGDWVAVLVLGGEGVFWLQPPASARRAVVVRVAALESGGGTPLASALAEANRALLAYARRYPAVQRHLWLLTDGRTLHDPVRPNAANRIVIVDFDNDRLPLSKSRQWAAAWGAIWCRG